MDIAVPLKREVWSRFVQEGVLDSARIRKRISESWYLCQQKGVNPYNGKGDQILTRPSLDRRLKDNKILFEIALPYVEKLRKLFGNAKSMVLLTDRNGYVLKATGHSDTLERALTINFMEGVKWTEDKVGTNAIGTALRIDEPITIIGTEHYSIASQPFVCSAAPIHDDEGTLVGVLDVTSPIDQSMHEHALAAVASTVFAIEQEWQRRVREDEIELLKYTSSDDDFSSAVILVNNKDQIVWMNKKVKQTFSMQERISMMEVLDAGFTAKTKIPISSSNHDGVIGYRMKIERKNKAPSIPSIEKFGFQFEGVVGTSQAFQNVLWNAEKVAKTDVTVHIHGETGTGKESIAKAIHENSDRKDGPFIAINCGAIPEALMESELFGYTAGSFTGASKNGYKGKIQQADGGTLFLDEIGEIPHSMQVALLRVFQESQVIPIGGSKPVDVNVRVITATHRNLQELMNKKQLREDLFYRIFVFPIYLPPLRERKEDLLAFIDYYQKKNNWHVTLPHEILTELHNYHWPGNIRELFNVLDRMRILYDAELPPDRLMENLLIHLPKTAEHQEAQRDELSYREKIEKEKMMNMLKQTDGNVSLAAQKLDMPRSTFYRKLKKFQLN
ncbi:sigma-54-dependent Fis family transcriptional regulator [Pseudalkalibacillus caeni]|uniref:Sigma-54-dependent Fis family transcriptional regulator n=1 Tax=Exobacillus caeni TaxID=2574798 RepID=A0A5R9EZK5_9BACL|nr:sigma-54-dependent Fis family transcriptional regulator [Pseudalkalibacillus caeni]TLS36231.1 sigma-54-dependent Fis family transcriptional regulator [Pseudalkalibacillus caeni]